MGYYEEQYRLIHESVCEKERERERSRFSYNNILIKHISPIL